MSPANAELRRPTALAPLAGGVVILTAKRNLMSKFQNQPNFASKEREPDWKKKVANLRSRGVGEKL
jgi:hypothetical protein